eukprot:2133076-Ditylum_brightwellii.AAC.1
MLVGLSRSDVVFVLVASTQENVMVLGEDNIRMLLKHHSKSIARITSTSKVMGRNMAKIFCYKMCVDLPKQAAY